MCGRFGIWCDLAIVLISEITYLFCLGQAPPPGMVKVMLDNEESGPCPPSP